jgi:chemotaxis protein methyltransferase CheR
MRNVAVPDLLKRAHGGRTLKIWSAACSTGMEAYTIAIRTRTNAMLNRKLRVLIVDDSASVI